MSASDYLEVQIGTHLLRTGSWTKPSAVYVALYTTVPDDTGGTEVGGSRGYARVQHGPSDATWTAPTTSGVFANIGTVQFGAPVTTNWGTIQGFGLYDAISAGNLLVVGTLTSPVVVNAGDPAPAFADGDLTVTIA